MDTVTILAALRHHPQTLDQLRHVTGLSRRECEFGVQQARLDGHPVISDSEGIRLSVDPAEVEQCAQRLRQRAIHQLLTARALRQTARRLRGVEQRELPWGEAA